MPDHRCAHSVRGPELMVRKRSLVRPSGMAIRSVAVGVLAAAIFSLPATARAADPIGPAPLFGGPSFFSLSVNGKVSGGATVKTKLTATHQLGLFVEREVGNNLVQPVGLVPLGVQTAGPHRLRWNLRVSRKQLAAGTYEVLLEILDGHGRPSGVPPSPTFAFVKISTHGHDSVRLQHLTLT